MVWESSLPKKTIDFLFNIEELDLSVKDGVGKSAIELIDIQLKNNKYNPDENLKFKNSLILYKFTSNLKKSNLIRIKTDRTEKKV